MFKELLAVMAIGAAAAVMATILVSHLITLGI